MPDKTSTSLRLVDHHGDGITAGVEKKPQPWWDEQSDETVSWPVVYVTGDAYLNPTQARELAQYLEKLADDLEAPTPASSRTGPSMEDR